MDPAGVKRRLTCILAADAVGYSRLVSEDEGNALRVLAAHRAVIDGILAFHDGRIVSTAGDSVLAEFGSAVEAVRCAVEIQDALRTRNEALPEAQRMQFRIGINLGDVVVKGDDILGDGVNVAARLEGIADPGGILIASSVYDQITGKLDLGFQDLGEQTLKNISRPVRAFRVAGAGATVRPAPAKPAAPAAATPRRLGPAAIVAIVAIAAVAVLAVTQGWFKPPRPPSSDDGAKAKLEAELAAARQARAEAEAAALKAKAEAEAAQVKARAATEAAATKAKAQADAAALRSKAVDASPPKPSSPAAAPPSAPVASAAPPPSPARPRVEGAWTVLQHCSAVGNAPPFQRTGEATVVDGEFVLERGTPGEPGFQRLRGKPTPDGTLTLTGTAISALPRNLGETFDLRYEGLWTGDRFELRGKFGNRTCRIELAHK